jgi:hypothetical protein
MIFYNKCTYISAKVNTVYGRVLRAYMDLNNNNPIPEKKKKKNKVIIKCEER